MTYDQEQKCHAIIHTHATIALAGQINPFGVVGFAVDMAAMTTMTMSLGAVFGADISMDVAKSLAIAALKKQIANQAAKQVLKFLPILGWIISGAMSFAMVEAAGWEMAARFDRDARQHIAA